MGTVQPKFQRIEAEDQSSFLSAIDAGLDQLEKLGLSGLEGEPKVSIVIQQNNNVTPDEDVNTKNVNIIVYVGATNEDIANDLLTRPE